MIGLNCMSLFPLPFFDIPFRGLDTAGDGFRELFLEITNGRGRVNGFTGKPGRGDQAFEFIAYIGADVSNYDTDGMSVSIVAGLFFHGEFTRKPDKDIVIVFELGFLDGPGRSVLMYPFECSGGEEAPIVTLNKRG